MFCLFCEQWAVHYFMVTSWYGNAFRVTGHLRGEPSITAGFPSQMYDNLDFIFLFF